ncbi:endonuclease MutS2 [Parvicella tangerina]|uniref:Endonuclease MutS2 n=1 Tax=Parvicella tangerina TaxID=2829795 RepID=A0A916NRC9_9FLAO|nr:MutS2/Smr-associated SH3 domain-containing protein [Parvicella tangerina]CAG5080901.1 Endonuclease MutS2 [Parvicella tangerina]
MNKPLIDKQSLNELQFDEVGELLAGYCKSDKAQQICANLSPFENEESLREEFNLLKEIKTIYDDEVYFPHPYFKDIKGAIKLLNVANGVLILNELLKVYRLCLGTKELVDFSIHNQSAFPAVFEACSHIEGIDEVIKPIADKLNAKNQIKDNATKKLAGIRSKLKSNREQINRNFDRLLKKYKKDEVLGDIEEVFLEEKRLLSVLSQHKKKVPGRVLDSSGGGALSYIEPFENQELNKEQEKLRYAERDEIFQILKELTEFLRSKKYYLSAYQRLLVRFDLLNAKIVFAKSYNGVLPRFGKDKWFWKDAVHPLLYLKNQPQNIPTIGQEISMDEETRFLVISGPNAGGKSITLKTAGLLQVMFQFGFLVPVNDISEFKWFNYIGSDIGDNQSIENQLSTYSYRIRRMKQFLKNSNPNALLLLDEFGSGSDPELGGALAEVFYERLYAMGTYAVITTHYNNIKILTANLPQAINGCMLFDTKALQPTYHLSIGQPGSSFTFEVAKNNGISNEIIDEAKERVSLGKIKLDELSVGLQKEKSKLEKVSAGHLKSKAKSDHLIQEYENKLLRLKKQAAKQADYFEQQNKFISLGKKVYDLIKKYKHHKTVKKLGEEVTKLVAMEKSKVLSKEKPVEFKNNLKQPDLPKLKNKISAPPKKTEKKKVSEMKEEVEEPADKVTFEVGNRVVHKSSRNRGVIQSIKGKEAEVLIGNFMVKVKLKDLEKGL